MLEVVDVPDRIVALLRGMAAVRTTQVRVNGELSEPIPYEAGVPQGDPLSCLLFLVFLESLSRYLVAHLRASTRWGCGSSTCCLTTWQHCRAPPRGYSTRWSLSARGAQRGAWRWASARARPRRCRSSRAKRLSRGYEEIEQALGRCDNAVFGSLIELVAGGTAPSPSLGHSTSPQLINTFCYKLVAVIHKAAATIAEPFWSTGPSKPRAPATLPREGATPECTCAAARTGDSDTGIDVDARAGGLQHAPWCMSGSAKPPCAQMLER